MIINKSDEKSFQKQIQSRDKNTFFPFVSGEKVEKRRLDLGNLLKQDLKSYLNYHGGKKSRYKNVTYSLTGSRQKMDRLDRNGNGVQSVSKQRFVKQLFDSSYVKPQDNYRVVQDTNPVKRAVLNDALTRFEKDLQLKNKQHTINLNLHQKQLKSDQDEIEAENINLQNKRKRFKQQIDEQIKMNVSMKKIKKL